MLNLLKPESEHSDNRRTLKQLVTTDIKQVNAFKVTKGSILGNHYHEKTYEYFYVMKGSFLVMIKNPGSLKASSKILNKDSFFMVAPNTAHNLEALTNGEFMTFLTRPYSKIDKDTFLDE